VAFLAEKVHTNLRMKLRYLGALLHRIGMPGWVKEGDYVSPSFGTTVSVRVSPLYTRVSIDGTEVFFDRVTGRIDGIGFSRGVDCKLDEVPELTRSGVVRD
jgi:hypothetical protein